MNEEHLRLIQKLQLNFGASQQKLAQLQSKLKIPFPKDYLDFLAASNGAEGWVGNSYVQIDPIEDILSSYNTSMNTIVFASNGANTTYVFVVDSTTLRIVEMDFIGWSVNEGISIGQTFVEFLEYLALK